MKVHNVSIVLIVLFALSFMCSCKNGLNDTPSISVNLMGKCQAWLDSLCSEAMKGRRTGSIYDEKAYIFLTETLSQIGYTYDVQEFLSRGGAGTLRNIIVRLSGTGDGCIIIGAHYDGAVLSNEGIHYPAANDNASGVVTTLALLDTLKQMDLKPTKTLVFAFWDGEEVYDGTWAQGSRHFVQSLPETHDILYYLNLDSIGHDHTLYVKYKGPVDETIASLVSNRRLSYSLIDMNGNNGGSSDYVPFGQAGIPYISFGDHNGDMCSYRSHSPDDRVEAISLNRIILHVQNILDMINLGSL